MDHSLRIVAVASTASLLLAGCGQIVESSSRSSSMPDSPAAACGALEKQLTFSQRFTPYEARRSVTAPPGESLAAQLRPTDPRNESTPRIASGAAAGEIKTGPRSTYAFGEKAVEALKRSGSLSAFYENGGALADRAPAADTEDYAATALVEEGARAQKVMIGGSEGAAVWADPVDEGGARPYVVLWRSAAGDDRRVIAEDVERAVSAARALECDEG